MRVPKKASEILHTFYTGVILYIVLRFFDHTFPLRQSYVSGLAHSLRHNRADNLAGSHEYNYMAIGIKCGIGNANISFSVLAARTLQSERRSARKEKKERERKGEKGADTTPAGEFEGGQSVAGGTSGTTWW